MPELGIRCVGNPELSCQRKRHVLQSTATAIRRHIQRQASIEVFADQKLIHQFLQRLIIENASLGPLEPTWQLEIQLLGDGLHCVQGAQGNTRTLYTQASSHQQGQISGDFHVQRRDTRQTPPQQFQALNGYIKRRR
ncbi:hypothetical protein D3C81_1711460 [compost metagenome]